MFLRYLLFDSSSDVLSVEGYFFRLYVSLYIFPLLRSTFQWFAARQCFLYELFHNIAFLWCQRYSRWAKRTFVYWKTYSHSIDP